MNIEDMVGRCEGASGVVFDFGGVISVSPMSKWERTLYPYCETLGLSAEAVREGFRRHRKLWDGDALSFEEMYRRIFAEAGLPSPTSVELAEIRRLDAASWVEELRPDTLELMRTLKARGKRLAILSNMSSDFHRDYFAPRCAAYRALVETEVISGFERICKPEARIYRLVEERLGLPPEKLLFFDDFVANVEAARSLGWRAVVMPPVSCKQDENHV